MIVGGVGGEDFEGDAARDVFLRSGCFWSKCLRGFLKKTFSVGDHDKWLPELFLGTVEFQALAAPRHRDRLDFKVYAIGSVEVKFVHVVKVLKTVGAGEYGVRLGKL